MTSPQSASAVGVRGIAASNFSQAAPVKAEPAKAAPGWYVAAHESELGAEPLERFLFGDPVVLYRKASGGVAALYDQCPHRFAPLSQGKVLGDALQCPYHGLVFGASGQCERNPQGPVPAAARVKSWATAERHGFVWIWHGEAADADPALIVDLSDTWALPDEASCSVWGSVRIEAGTALVIDNLMDLSHAAYLHPTTLVTEGYAEILRVEVQHVGDDIVAGHYTEDGPVPVQFVPFWNLPTCDSRGVMRWHAPASLKLEVGVSPPGQPVFGHPMIRMAHLLMPEGEASTRYYWIATRNFLPDNEQVSEMMKAGINYAFSMEDKPMIEAVQRRMGNRDFNALKPVMLKGDAAAVQVRRACAAHGL